MKINPTDVEIIANELEVTILISVTDYFANYPKWVCSQVYLNTQLDKKIAERTLREHKGDAVAAVRSLLR